MQGKEATKVSRGKEMKKRSINRMPEGSLFYERIVPILLVVMGVLTASMILFAAGVILGIIPFS